LAAGVEPYSFEEMSRRLAAAWVNSWRCVDDTHRGGEKLSDNGSSKTARAAVVQSPMQASGLGDGFHMLRAERRRPGERLTVQMVVAFIGAEGGSAEKKKEGEEGAVLGCHVEKGGGVRPDQRAALGRQWLGADGGGHALNRGGGWLLDSNHSKLWPTQKGPFLAQKIWNKIWLWTFWIKEQLSP
jgi:hypothetical protein